MISFSDFLNATLTDGSFQKLVLSRLLPGQTQIPQRITVRPIVLGSGDPAYQWTERLDQKEIHKNLSRGDLEERAFHALGATYGDAYLFTTEFEHAFRVRPDGKIKRKSKAQPRAAIAPTHNRSKNYLIPEGTPCPFLAAIGVMTPDGQVKATMQHKFRQINRYLEFIDDILPELPQEGVLQIVDFGCGKSYLTFAVHYLLQTLRGREVQMTGIDRKQDVVQHCQAVAQKLNVPGLAFQTGEIADFQPQGAVHLAISLHACDTATDDALAAALGWSTQVIFAAPCCQHELSRLLPDDCLPGMLGYGIAKERFAALATDTLRARFLEEQGYRTQLLEFIDLEHTPKNLLIRAVRRHAKQDQPVKAPSKQGYQQLKAELGLGEWHLETACQRWQQVEMS